MGETRDQPRGIGLPAMRIYDADPPPNSHARPALSLALYVAAVFIGGALLAPQLYRLANRIAPGSHLAGEPFHRYLDRSLLGIALLGIWPLLRSLGFRSPLTLFRAATPGQWRRLAKGLAVGFVSLGIVALACLAAQARHFGLEGNMAHVLAKFAGAVGTAAVVAVLEEFLFRGAIFGALRRGGNWRLALISSSAIYAVVHFLTKHDLPGPVTWYSGLELLRQTFAPLTDPHETVPAFFSLTVAGIILAFAYQRTGDLYFSIGLHAGWIFWLKFYGFLTSATPNTATVFWGTENIVDGWLGFLVLVAVWIVLPRVVPRERNARDL